MAGVRELPDLGPYEPLFRIGAGGMGEVYAARRKSFRSAEIVAVKRLFPHLVEDRRFVDMLIDEARITSAVSSPHVVRVLDVGRAGDDVPYLVMELIAGCDLAHLGGQGKTLPIPAVVEWVAQAAEGLHAAHEARSPTGEPLGLVHRDVSPENVLVGVDGLARIGDFGIAYARERIQQTTAQGRVKGKLAYMSPEQTHADRLDRRSDIFSLGIVAWEGLTGQFLFDGPTAPDVIAKVRSEAISPPHHKRPDVSRELSMVVMKALDRQPAQRYQTALAFAESLRAAAPRKPTPGELANAMRQASAGPLTSIREGLTKTWPQAIPVIDKGNMSKVAIARRGPLVAIAGIAFLLAGLSAFLLSR
jgi:serine/threonine protein kinase